MAHIIKITITGGAFGGPTVDKQISINADNIINIEDALPGYIGTSRITMSDGSTYYVSETRDQLENLINKK
jgi:hypothetical protein